jgi:hypothetical protein
VCATIEEDDVRDEGNFRIKKDAGELATVCENCLEGKLLTVVIPKTRFWDYYR